MAEGETEPKSETRQGRSHGTSRRDDAIHYGSVGLTGLAQAIGNCATELATGSVKVAGELITDLVGAVCDPIDRVIGSGEYVRERERLVAPESAPRREQGITRAVSRAASAMAHTVARSQQRFQEGLDVREKAGQRPEEPSR